MRSFPAQLETTDHSLDVVVRIDDQTVLIESAGDTLGSWDRTACSFERTARGAYRFAADGDTIGLRVADEAGFRGAIQLIRTEKVSILPKTLMMVGAAAIGTAVTVATLGSGEAPAVAAPPEADVTTTTVSPLPTTAPTPPPPSDDLATRWDEAAAGTGMELDGRATVVFGFYLSVVTTDDSVIVEATPTPDQDQSEQIMGALGLAIASIDPSLEPGDRRAVLATLGLDVYGDNRYPLHTSTCTETIEYTLDFEPGESLRFTAVER